MYKPYISNDTLLFPPNFGDFIPSDAPARLISDIVDVMDLKEIHASYSEASDGQPPYHPAMLLKAVLFGYMNKIYSTRGLESAMTRDAHLIWLSSYQFPDHTTIRRFKTRCMPYIKVIFSRLVRILAERGEIELTEDLYIDGTTIRSRAAGVVSDGAVTPRGSGLRPMPTYRRESKPCSSRLKTVTARVTVMPDM